MKKIAFAGVLFVSGLAWAAPAAQPQDAGDTRCRKEVKDYVETLKFVRQAAGEQIGDKVAKGYVGEAELVQVSDTQGPCAAVKLLREKGARR